MSFYADILDRMGGEVWPEIAAALRRLVRNDAICREVLAEMPHDDNNRVQRLADDMLRRHGIEE